MRATSYYGNDITREFKSDNPIHNEHIEEFKIMMTEAIEARVPELARAQCVNLINDAVRAMIGALRFDIETSLEIAFKDLGDMYKDKRVRKYVSDAVCKAIEKRLSDITIKL